MAFMAKSAMSERIDWVLRIERVFSEILSFRLGNSLMRLAQELVSGHNFEPIIWGVNAIEFCAGADVWASNGGITWRICHRDHV